MWGHLTIYHCWPGRGPAAACSHQETSGGGGGVITRSDLRDGLLGQAEADPLLDSAPPGLLGDQDRPLVVVRHPDWSEQGAAGAVPGPAARPRPPRRGTVGGEVGVDLHTGQPRPQLPDAAPGHALAVVARQKCVTA